MGYRAALVDFDGTLADSMPYWMDLPWKAFRRSGLTPPEDFAELLRSAPMWEVARQLSRRYPGLSPDRPLEDYWLALMEENYLTRVALKPGALELLALLRRRGLKIVVLSATRQPMLGVALEHFGLPPRIDAVLSEAEVGSKRSRAPYEACGEFWAVRCRSCCSSRTPPRIWNAPALWAWAPWGSTTTPWPLRCPCCGKTRTYIWRIFPIFRLWRPCWRADFRAEPEKNRLSPQKSLDNIPLLPYTEFKKVKKVKNSWR